MSGPIPQYYDEDRWVAVQVVHNVCGFLQSTLTSGLPPEYTNGRPHDLCPPPIQLAAQVLLIDQITKRRPQDTFVAEFRTHNHKKVSDRKITRVRELLSSAASYGQGWQMGTSLQKQTILHYLDPGGKIHKGGINPHARDRKSRDLMPQPTFVTTGGANNSPRGLHRSGIRTNVNRVWVVVPLDNIGAALQGNQYCVSATLVINGEQHITAIGVSPVNYRVSEPYNFACGSASHDGQLFLAIQGEGAWSAKMSIQNYGQWIRIQNRYQNKTSRNPRDPHSIPSWDIGVPDKQDPDARGGLTRKYVRRSRTSMAEPQCTGPKCSELLQMHTVHHMPSALMRYIQIVSGNLDASICIPRSTNSKYSSDIWNEAGGSLLLSEAGGVVTDAEGQSLDLTVGRSLTKNFGVLAACHESTHSRLLGAIKGQFLTDGWSDLAPWGRMGGLHATPARAVQDLQPTQGQIFDNINEFDARHNVGSAVVYKPQEPSGWVEKRHFWPT